MMKGKFVLKGNICYSKDATTFETIENGYLVCEDGISKGAYKELPAEYRDIPVTDYGDNLIIPGLSDLHIHAPQFSFRSLGMDLELLDWLNTHTFPEEAKYKDLDYAKKAYTDFVKDIKRGPNTRSVVFATAHVPATNLLMDMMEEAGLVSMIGKVNMDRNSHPDLEEVSAEASANDTVAWLKESIGKYKNTTPILTPRFIPSCTDDLMRKLKEIEQEFKIPVQSHLSENQGEIFWVKELVPDAKFYGDAYEKFGLFGGDTPTVMAHCVWSDEAETALMKKNNVFVAHCPQSNTNLSSGIAPIRHFMDEGLSIGLGSDVAGGAHSSIFRAMSDAIQVSKLYWRLVNQDNAALTVEEAFYLGTIGGGKFFGKVGSFANDYEFDAVVIDDSSILPQRRDLNISDRITRVIYQSDDRHIKAKYVRGTSIL